MRKGLQSAMKVEGNLFRWLTVNMKDHGLGPSMDLGNRINGVAIITHLELRL